ncbi:MAG: hypothetical protein QOI38_2073, partial [Sphingomonadales bacterium]|nr:hypothetical protein [Sphingomonadales bacterium]
MRRAFGMMAVTGFVEHSTAGQARLARDHALRGGDGA